MTSHEMAELWATHPSFDEETRSKAREILSRPQEIASCFGTDLTFGTGGLRGVLGVGTNRMNVYTVARATQALSRYLLKNGGHGVAIAYDSRHCSRQFAFVAAGVLAQNGIVAHIYPRLMPTPMLSFAVRALGCDAGIVITASHNPAQYNGYKVYGPDGCQITEEAAGAIIDELESVPHTGMAWLSPEEAQARDLLVEIPQQVCDDFVARTLACRVDPKVCAPLRVVYTPLHGTGLEPVRRVLGSMSGVQVIEVASQCRPDGDFPTCPKPNPELREALRLGLETAAAERADLLIATDPDCDRVGVAVRDASGAYEVLTGNEVGLLLLEYLLRTRRAQGNLPERPVVVKTIVTSDLAFAIAKTYGAQVVEVLTGFKYIGETIGRLERAGEADRFVFGFEESCGYLAGTHVRDKDGVMACMLVTEMAQACAARGTTLKAELDALYARYGFMENSLLNFDIPGAVPMDEMRRVMCSLREEPIEHLAGAQVTSVKDYAAGLDGLPPSDVLSYAAGALKAIVRPSGTEPKVKVYLSARADDPAVADALLDAMAEEINERILG